MLNPYAYFGSSLNLDGKTLPPLKEIQTVVSPVSVTKYSTALEKDYFIRYNSNNTIRRISFNNNLDIQCMDAGNMEGFTFKYDNNQLKRIEYKTLVFELDADNGTILSISEKSDKMFSGADITSIENMKQRTRENGYVNSLVGTQFVKKRDGSSFWIKRQNPSLLTVSYDKQGKLAACRYCFNDGNHKNTVRLMFKQVDNQNITELMCAEIYDNDDQLIAQTELKNARPVADKIKFEKRQYQVFTYDYPNNDIIITSVSHQTLDAGRWNYSGDLFIFEQPTNALFDLPKAGYKQKYWNIKYALATYCNYFNVGKNEHFLIKFKKGQPIKYGYMSNNNMKTGAWKILRKKDEWDDIFTISTRPVSRRLMHKTGYGMVDWHL